MECCQADGIKELFSPQVAAKELTRYRKKGAVKTTRILLDVLKSYGVRGMTVLDIGGGVGVIHHELLRAGVRKATSVDVSSSYLKAAQQEAERQGHLDRLHQFHGDFVEMARKIPEADIVTLDRVICCYDDMERLVGLSAERALKLYAVIYPPDHWLIKALTWLENLKHRMRRNQFRVFAHTNMAVDAMIRRAGLERFFSYKSLLWNIEVYRRSAS